MILGGKIKDLKLLIDFYGENAKVYDILKHAVNTNFSIFDAQSQEWDLNLF